MALVQGVIDLEVEIDARGKVTSAKAIGGNPILLRASEANVRDWTFLIPSHLDKFPVKHNITYIYKLVGVRAVNPGCPSVVLRLPDRVEITARPPILNPDREKVPRGEM